MDYLKIVSKGWQGYNGQLNIITFKDGVSTEPVDRRIADRIAASVSVVRCNADGTEGEEIEPVGPQHRLISETLVRAAVTTSLATQSEADKAMEARLDAARVLTAPLETLFTREELEKVADGTGMKGLREVGDKWNVRGRAIPELIDKILAAQSEFLQLRNQKLDEVGGQILKATTLATDEVTEVEAVEDASEDLVAAGADTLAPEYKIGDVIVPVSTLIEAALTHSGKSLTGWNALSDNDRLVHIEKEIAALEAHYGSKLEPIGDTPAPSVPNTEEPDDKGEEKVDGDQGKDA